MLLEVLRIRLPQILRRNERADDTFANHRVGLAQPEGFANGSTGLAVHSAGVAPVRSDGLF